MNPEVTPFCSQHSSDVGEPLFGTAPRTDVWLLLEYPGPHASKAFDDSDLSEPVKNHLTKFLKDSANARLVLIKKSSEQKTQQRQIFVAAANDAAAQLHRFQINSYPEILDLDFSAIVKDGPVYSGNRYDQPILLVCTNGKRDRCCAKYGLPLYEKLVKLAPEITWQSSHVGGHRFAPNIINLPSGIYYGRFTIMDAADIVRSTHEGTILLDHYRGRASIPAEAQAAEFYLRGQTGILQDDAIHLLDITQNQENQRIVRFRTAAGIIHTVHIAVELSEFAVLESCSTPEKRTRQTLYRNLGIK